MRIIAGKFKNRKLITPKGLETRPTSEKMREAVFNMLQHVVEDSVFLDLFAGSGAMGFEALSRGAERVVFLDKSRQAVQCIQKNVDVFDAGSQTAIIKGDVFRSLEKLEENQERFDIIYVDPPYFTGEEQGQLGLPLSGRILEAIDGGNLLKEYGKLFIEESKEVKLDAVDLLTLRFIRQRSFGRSRLFHFEK